MVTRLVVGCSGAGLTVVESLRERWGDLYVLGSDEGRVEQLRNDKITAEVGDIAARETFEALDYRPDVVVVASNDPELNETAAEHVRAVFPWVHLLAFVDEEATRADIEALESVADSVFNPGVALVDHIAEVVALDSAERLRSLRATLERIDGTLGIFMHDNPDPDAIASAVALAQVAEWHGVDATPVYYGSISHQENRAFVNLLELALENPDPGDPVDYDAVALVDHSSPGVNDQLPPDTAVSIVIDHHPAKQPVEADYVDIREAVGATSTLLVDYLRGYGIEIDVAVATGLLYGIRIDTKDFAREITSADFEAAAFLLPRADVDVLQRIETPSISNDTIDTIGRAIRNRERRGSVLATCVGALSDRDALAQAADRLLNMEDIAVTLVYGFMDGTIYVSARSRGVDIDLGDVLRDAFLEMGSAGGHADMAGAQLSLGVFESLGETAEADLAVMVEDVITNRFFSVLEPESLEE